ncbi:hypothetical protein FACS1894216_20450 [Synergistales bacterium]|nr:hypothetical protein FACS1894216_20450 [Synergistales bacterium]
MGSTVRVGVDRERLKNYYNNNAPETLNQTGDDSVINASESAIDNAGLLPLIKLLHIIHIS